MDILEGLVCARQIECKDNRTDMIRQPKLDDEGKYVRDTILEKDGDGFLIGIDSANQDLMIQMGKLIESGDARRDYYANGRHYYTSKINILDNELD